MNINQILKQAQQAQAKMAKISEEIGKMEFEGTSGGGAVTARTNGEGRLLALTLSPEALKEGDPEMLQDLIIAAVNGAIESGKATAQQRLRAAAGGMGLPPGMGF